MRSFQLALTNPDKLIEPQMYKNIYAPVDRHGVCFYALTLAGGTPMMTVIRQWLDSLDDVEDDLRSHAYVVVHGAAGSFVIPVGSDRQPPDRRRFVLWELLQLHPA